MHELAVTESTSSPSAGKTTLIERTYGLLRRRMREFAA